MRLDIDPKAYEHIKSKGGVLTIRTAVSKGCCGSMPLPEFSYAKPKEAAGLEALRQDEVEVYVGKSMRFEGEVLRIELSGAWVLKSLELPTLRLLESCERG